MSATTLNPLRVLIVEDEPFNRMALQAILEAINYEVLQAANGKEAVELFKNNNNIDLILMDVMMPVMDGYEATKRIKQLCTDEMVPVIFLTSSDDDDHLAECIASGGDDFLIKPVTPKILLSKIKAQLRISELYYTVKQQKDELDKRRLDDQRDHEIAESIFKRIVHLGGLDESNIPYITSPAALFNGDILLAAKTPSNAMRVMLGDFTGHGLSAAVGAIPTAEIFYKMTNQGHSLSEVIKELNRKLHQILPPGLFCAASFAEINYQENTLQTWVGGSPDMIRYGNSPREILQRHHSTNLSLGILPDEQFDNSTQSSMIHPEDCILIYTDGLVEAENNQKEMFDQCRVENCIVTSGEDNWVIPQLMKQLAEFSEGKTQQDDITLIELPCSLHQQQASFAKQQTNKFPATHWKFTLVIDGETLKHADPLPLLLRNLSELQDLKNHRSNLYTILAELFNNTLDHGLMKLDSTLKRTPDGFMEYFELREKRLAELSEDDYIEVTFEHHPQSNGGILNIKIKDSTEGFDISTIPDIDLGHHDGHSGRGIPLLRSLCESLTYHPPGNFVEAVYLWS